MGANKWTDGFEQHFKGARICIIPDNDETGRKHQELYAAKLAPVAKQLVTLDLPGLPEKGDLSDFIAAHDTLEAARAAFLKAFEERAKEWKPSADEPHQEAPAATRMACSVRTRVQSRLSTEMKTFSATAIVLRAGSDGMAGDGDGMKSGCIFHMLRRGYPGRCLGTVGTRPARQRDGHHSARVQRHLHRLTHASL